MEGRNWQTIEIPFVAGLDTKTHGYALDPPGLSLAQNVEFDEARALRLRKPYASIGTDIYPSGTLADVRKLAVLDDELCVFTETELYAWSPGLSKWVSRGTHLAVATQEATRFGNTSDQTFADRAELDGVIAYVWSETSPSGTLCYFAAIDATTGATLSGPTSFGASNTRPRVVATSTVFHVYWIDNALASLVVEAVDPAAPTFSPSSPLDLGSFTGPYDVVKDPNADATVAAVVSTGGTAYDVHRVTAGLSATSSAKVRTADGIIAVACADNGNTLIMRTDGNNVRGDLLTTSSLADTANLDVAIGSGSTTIDHLTGSFASTTATVFWSAGETTGATSYPLEKNTITTGATVGTEATLVLRQGIASRAFTYDGNVYLWTVFAGASSTNGMAKALGLRAQLQNTYYLYRADGHLVAKATHLRAGGLRPLDGHLPGVALVSGTTGYAWAGIERQIIATGGTDHSDYEARAPRDITFQFDSDEARRTVQLGRTLYVSGGLVLQYDGEGLAEVGFEQGPWYLDANATDGTGGLDTGSYSYKSTLRWQNARGESERSTSFVGAQLAVADSDNATDDQANFAIVNVHVTRKQGSRRLPATEIWRTKIDPVPESPFYLTTSKDPSATGNNRYVENDPTLATPAFTYVDGFTDGTLETKEQHPENGGELPRLAPPPATILAASDARLFLAGVAGDPYRVHYSLLRDDHQIAAFNPALSFTVPTWTGPITGLALLNESLIVFTARAVYLVGGAGFDNVGGGSNYGSPHLISSDVGATSQDLIARYPRGLLFHSRKGWYRIGLGWELEYVGAPVESFNGDTFVAAQTLEDRHQVRILSDARMLVFDYLMGQWAEWSQANGRDLATWSETPILLDTVAKAQQLSDWSADPVIDYNEDVTTGWIKLSGLQGYGRTRWLEILAEPASASIDTSVRVRTYLDYNDATAVDDKTFTFGTAGVPIRLGLSRPRAGAVKVRITCDNDGTGSGGEGVPDPASPGIILVGLALEVGIDPGIRRNLASTRKA